MSISANDFMEQLDVAGHTALETPESQVIDTCLMMGSNDSEIIEQNFEMAQNEQQPDYDATPTMGFEPS